MGFDKYTYIKSIKSSVDKLVSDLNKQGIQFEPTDGELENVVFTKGDETYKMAYQCFYRLSGMCVYYKEFDGKKGQSMLKPVFIPIDEYINGYIKALILKNFK